MIKSVKPGGRKELELDNLDSMFIYISILYPKSNPF